MSHLKLVTGNVSPHTAVYVEALEHLDIGMCIVDEDGTVLVSNQNFRELLDLPADWPSLQEAAKTHSAAEELVTGWVVRVEAQGDFRETVALTDDATLLVGGKALPSGGVSLTVTEAADREHRDLAEDVARFRALLAHMPSTISLKDADGRFLIINEAWQRDLKIPAEKMLGKTIWDAFPDDDWSDSDASDRLLLSGERDVIEDEIAVGIVGRGRRVYRRTKFPVLDNRGRPVGIGTINTDITEQTKAREDLRRSEVGLSHAQRLAKIGHWERNLVTGEVFWSEPLFEFFNIEKGTTPDFELLVSRLHPDDRHKLSDAMTAVFGGKKFQEFELRVRSASGEKRHLRDVLEAEFDGEGRPIRVFGVVQDITEAKLAESALRRSEAGLRHAQKLARIGNWEKNLVTGEVFWSDEVFRILGFEKQPVPTVEQVLRHVHPYDRQTLRDKLDAVLAGVAQHDIEFRVLLPSGEIRYVNELTEVELDSDGKAVRCIGVIQDITEAKLAEQALRRSEAVLNNAQQLARMGSVERNFATGEAYWSDSVYDIFGIDKHPTVPDFVEIMDHLHPDDVSAYDDMLSAMFAGEAKQELDFQVVLPSGDIRYVHELLEAEFDGAGNATRCIAVIQDVTDRNLAEIGLRESEHRFRSLIDNLPSAVSLKDRDHRFVIVNKSFEDIFNQKAESIIGQPVLSAMPDHADWDSVIAADQEILDGQRTTFSETITLNLGDGVERTFELRKFSVADAAGRVTGVGTISTDITDRLNAEEQMRESEAKFRAIFDEAGLGIGVVGDGGEFLEVNSAMAKMFGLTRDEMIGESIVSLTEPGDLKGSREQFEAVPNNENKIAHFDKRYRRKDADPFDAKLTTTAVFDEDGAFKFTVALVEDITERKKAHSALRESEASLEQAQRIAQLGSWVWDARRDELTWSQGLLRLLQLDEVDSKAAREQFRAMVHPDDRDKILAYTDLPDHGETGESGDYRIIRDDGSEHIFRTLWQVERDDAGAVARIVGVTQDVTEIRRSEAALRKSEASLANAQRIARLGNWDWDIANNGLYWSDEIYKIFGLQPREFDETYEAFFNTIHPDDRDLVQQAVDAALNNSGNYSIDHRIVLSGGEIRIVHEQGEVIYDEAGRAVRMHGTVQDVTEQRQAELALAESEERFRTMIDNLPSAISLRDREHRYVLVNRAFASVYNRDPQDVLGRQSHEVFPVREWTDLEEADQKLFTGEMDLFELEYELEVTDGDRRVYELTKFPVHDARGDVVNIGTISTDITDRTRAERTLRESEARFRALVDNLPAGVILKDADGNVVFINGRIEDWYGVPLERIAGRRFHDVTERSEANVAVHRKMLDAQRKASVTGDAVEIEHSITFADGSVHDLHAIIFPVERGDGGQNDIGNITFDVTDRKRTDEMLRQAQKMEVVGQLTGGVAHDFNNLLAVVIGNLEMAADILQAGSPELEFIRNAFTAAERGASLTHHLLAFSRQQVLQPEETDIGELIADTKDLMAVSMGERIVMGVRAERDLWRCKVDPVQLQNAILNLSINARDAMPSGGEVTIGADNVIVDNMRAQPLEVVAGDYVCLSVRDTGPGIPKDVLEHVYEPFFTTKAVGEGSGLGLSMVYGFVRQSGGAVAIDTAEGAGTTVRLYFPAVPSSVAADIGVDGDEEGVAQPEPDATILLVEDNAAFRDITSKILRSVNFRVIEAGTAEAALAVIGGTTKFDLLLSDIGLPGDMNGHDLAEFAASARPGLKIVLMSAHTDPGVIGGVIDRNVSAFLRKPDRKEELTKTLCQILGLDS